MIEWERINHKSLNSDFVSEFGHLLTLSLPVNCLTPLFLVFSPAK